MTKKDKKKDKETDKEKTIFEGSIKKQGFAPEKEEFLEPEEHEESSDKFSEEIDTGEKEEDVYTKEGREELSEGDEIEPWEQGFSEGAADKGGLAKCSHCGKILEERGKIVEKEVNHKLLFFCSEKCAKGCLAKHRAD